MELGVCFLFIIFYLVVIFQCVDPYYLFLIRRKALALSLCSLILWRIRQVEHPFCNSLMTPFSFGVCEICAQLLMVKANKTVWLQQTLIYLQNQLRDIARNLYASPWTAKWWLHGDVYMYPYTSFLYNKSNCHAKAHISTPISTYTVHPKRFTSLKTAKTQWMVDTITDNGFSLLKPL